MYVDKGRTGRKTQNSGLIEDESACQILALYLLFANSSKQGKPPGKGFEDSIYVSCAVRQIQLNIPGNGNTWVSYREASSQSILLQPPIIQLRIGKPQVWL